MEQILHFDDFSDRCFFLIMRIKINLDTFNAHITSNAQQLKSQYSGCMKKEINCALNKFYASHVSFGKHTHIPKQTVTHRCNPNLISAQNTKNKHAHICVLSKCFYPAKNCASNLQRKYFQITLKGVQFVMKNVSNIYPTNKIRY